MRKKIDALPEVFLSAKDSSATVRSLNISIELRSSLQSYWRAFSVEAILAHPIKLRFDKGWRRSGHAEPLEERRDERQHGIDEVRLDGSHRGAAL